MGYWLSRIVSIYRHRPFLFQQQIGNVLKLPTERQTVKNGYKKYDNGMCQSTSVREKKYLFVERFERSIVLFQGRILSGADSGI